MLRFCFHFLICLLTFKYIENIKKLRFAFAFSLREQSSSQKALCTFYILGHPFNDWVLTAYALSYNGTRTATHKHSFKSNFINGRAKASYKKRTCRHADEESRQQMALSTMPRTILFYKNYKKINYKTLVKKIVLRLSIFLGISNHKSFNFLNWK